MHNQAQQNIPTDAMSTTIMHTNKASFFFSKKKKKDKQAGNAHSSEPQPTSHFLMNRNYQVWSSSFHKIFILTLVNSENH